uniref:Uncharacterized protein n=1 Tax=Zooxanthella nutricula TaxID=1333877 RepID=A0A7S2II30_9DINO|mmetsp:Transcript_18238/g.54548  ORF Transcript_18238/g.54548 Transcript_18238/m.54548 type:complete len:194 (+) Transcript_18238:3-584(+)
MSDMDVAGADLTSKIGRRFSAARDPRYASSPAFSFGRRLTDELNSLSSNSTFYCKTGSHRAPNGESLLGKNGRRDDRHMDNLIRLGRQWKATPGPGAYRTPRALGGRTDIAKEVQVGAVQIPCRTPTWRMSTSTRPRVYHTLGGSGHTHEHEGPLRMPTPRNLSPGPGRYYQHCDSCPSLFSDFCRPQNKQVV